MGLVAQLRGSNSAADAATQFQSDMSVTEVGSAMFNGCRSAARIGDAASKRQEHHWAGGATSQMTAAP